jgi:hypothetical protein
MIIAERLETALPITETLTKFGLETGATLEASIFDPRAGVALPWLIDWTAGTWGASKATETLTEDDPTDRTGRYTAHANVSSAQAASDYLDLYVEVTAGGQGASSSKIALVKNLQDAARETTGGPGPWTTASGDPVIANPIIEAINAQTVLLTAAFADEATCTTQILPVLYTGHKGTNLIVPVYRNNTLIPDSELANGSAFAMSVNNISDGTTLDITMLVEWVGTGNLSYTNRAGDGVFESAGKWEYQATGLTEQGQPFVSIRLTARVYDEIV